jgi:MerR family transcriptional regulator, light-induced transcriptional regulator
MNDPAPDPATVVDAMLRAAEAYDIEACEALLAGAVAGLPPLVLVRDVVSPVLREAGSRWHRGEMSVAQEHMVSGVVRRQLSFALDRHLASATGPSILFTTLSGERHEMGGLMGAVLAASRGFRCIYLGPDLPAAEIGRFCANRHIDALALSLVTQPEVIDAHAQLAELRNLVPADVEIWVAGRAAQSLGLPDLPTGVQVIKDMASFLERLAGLHAR